MPSAGCAEEAAERVAIELAAQAGVYLESAGDESFADWSKRVFMELPRTAPRTPRPSLFVLKPLGEVLSRLDANGQARAVRDLLQRYPLEAQDGAGVSYFSHEEWLLVAVDLKVDCVVRLALHGDPPRCGLVEVWPGHALHRLNAAAKGGSFAQIPGGRSSAIEIDISHPSDSYGGPDDEIIA